MSLKSLILIRMPAILVLLSTVFWAACSREDSFPDFLSPTTDTVALSGAAPNDWSCVSFDSPLPGSAFSIGDSVSISGTVASTYQVLLKGVATAVVTNGPDTLYVCSIPIDVPGNSTLNVIFPEPFVYLDCVDHTFRVTYLTRSEEADTTNNSCQAVVYCQDGDCTCSALDVDALGTVHFRNLVFTPGKKGKYKNLQGPSDLIEFDIEPIDATIECQPEELGETCEGTVTLRKASEFWADLVKGHHLKDNGDTDKWRRNILGKKEGKGKPGKRAKYIKCKIDSYEWDPDKGPAGEWVKRGASARTVAANCGASSTYRLRWHVTIDIPLQRSRKPVSEDPNGNKLYNYTRKRVIGKKTLELVKDCPPAAAVANGRITVYFDNFRAHGPLFGLTSP